MDPISTIKHIFGHHYPRQHLFLAGALSIALTGVLLAPAESRDTSRRIVLDLPAPAGSEAAGPIDGAPLVPQPTASLGNDTPEVGAAPLPQAPEPGAANRQQPAAQQAGSGATEQEPDAWRRVQVSSGDNLSGLFTEVGLNARDLQQIIDSSSDTSILNRLHPGDQLEFHIPESGRLEQLEVHTSPLEGYRFTLNGDDYEVETIERSADQVTVTRQGELTDSLFMSARRADIPTTVIMEMADIFGGVIDFILDPRRGDRFSIIYEETRLDGEQVGLGEVLGARYVNRGNEYVALRYQSEDGETGYFNPGGESMQKAFLRNPLDVFRISSDFNPNRRHPIHNTIRAHKGTDYAAPRGTPIRATADGVVTRASRYGSFGNLVVIKHHGQFETKYAHLNGYANGISKGTRIEQGQVIGYVGATGGATGPHLHYEFLVAGEHKNPRTIVDELPQAVSLDESELPRFREHTRETLSRLRHGENDGRLLSYNDGTDTSASAGNGD